MFLYLNKLLYLKNSSDDLFAVSQGVAGIIWDAFSHDYFTIERVLQFIIFMQIFLTTIIYILLQRKICFSLDMSNFKLRN